MRDAVLQVERLEGARIAVAYTLGRSAAQITPEEWCEFAERLAAAGGGLLGTGIDGACLYGVAAFQPLITLRHGPGLWVEFINAVELGAAPLARNSLEAGLRDIARKNGCHCMVFSETVGSPALQPNPAKMRVIPLNPAESPSSPPCVS